MTQILCLSNVFTLPLRSTCRQLRGTEPRPPMASKSFMHQSAAAEGNPERNDRPNSSSGFISFAQETSFRVQGG